MNSEISLTESRQTAYNPETPMWALYSILSALAMAVVNIIDKFVLSKWNLKPIVLLLFLGLIGLVPAPLLLLSRGWPPFSGNTAFFTAAAGLFFILMTVLYFQAARSEEISRVVPLFYLSPLFVSLLAWLFLGEVFASKTYAGIFMLMAGAVLINARKGAFFKPGKALLLMILAALAMSLYLISNKQALKTADFWTVFALVRFWTFILLIPWLIRRWPDLRAAVRAHGPKVVGLIGANEGIALAATLFGTVAASLGPITLFTALSSLQPFFVLIFALLLSRFFPALLKEETSRFEVLLKGLSILLMFAGAVLIT